MKCPECGGALQQAISVKILRTTGPVFLDPPGAWCRTVTCSYGAVSINQPNVEHPQRTAAAYKVMTEEAIRLKKYVELLANIIPDVECDPERIDGRPVFTGSRLPLEVVINSVVLGESDEELLSGYPRLNIFLLSIIRSVVTAIPFR
jgi:uncharacterized protein (DUF433 family)